MLCRELQFMQMLKIVFCAVNFLSSAQVLYSQTDNFALAKGPHRDLVLQNCLGCHSELIITQNHMSRRSWDQKITWMQQTQNLWPLAPELRSKILDYLEYTQGPLAIKEEKDFMDGLGPRRANPLLFNPKGGN